jgi:acyl-CoA thioesterase FadM
VNLIWRTMLHFVLSARRPRADVFDVVRLAFRVLPTDLDIYRHMNNGRYLSIADVARFDMLRRTGLWEMLNRHGWYPVVQSSTITHRISLLPWQRFVIESRLMGFDERAVYMEQRFLVGDQIAARLVLKARFLKRGGGPVPLSEMSAALGVDVSTHIPPEWVHRWADDVALPSTRQQAPSVWDEHRLRED